MGKITKDSSVSKLVSIGIPTYNRSVGLERTLRQLTAQTYANLEIIVSDNCSPNPEVEAICRKFASADPRIRYHRQNSNIGSLENFHYVYRQAGGDYFMWAADDDEWEPEYVQELVTLLEENPSASLAFCNFDARYSNGVVEKSYPPFLPLLQQYAGKPLFERLKNYLLQEESHGKANVIYGLFRKSYLDEKDGFTREVFGSWGGDMLTVFELLSQSDLLLCPRLLYHVGMPEPSIDKEVAPQNIKKNKASQHLETHGQYFMGYMKIIKRCALLSLREKVLLYASIISKWIVWIKRDMTN